SYEIAWSSKDGKAHSFTLLEDGTLESVSVALEETPPPVNATIVKEISSAQLKEISKVLDENPVLFEVTVTRDRFDHEFTVAADGKLHSRQNYLWELPWAAKETVQRTIGAGAVLRIDQLFYK